MYLDLEPPRVMGFCELHPESEKSYGDHVLTLQKVGCPGCSLPIQGLRRRNVRSLCRKEMRKAGGMETEKGEGKTWQALKAR